MQVAAWGLDPKLTAAIVRAYNDWAAKFVARADAENGNGSLLAVGQLSLHDVDAASRRGAPRRDRARLPGVLRAPRTAAARRDAGARPTTTRCGRRSRSSGSRSRSTTSPAPASARSAPTGSASGRSPASPPPSRSRPSSRCSRSSSAASATATRASASSCSSRARAGCRSGCGGSTSCTSATRVSTSSRCRHRRATCSGASASCRPRWRSPRCERVVDSLGVDCVVTASDFPHPEGTFPDGVRDFIARSDLTDDTKRRILWDNANRLYGT